MAALRTSLPTVKGKTQYGGTTPIRGHGTRVRLPMVKGKTQYWCIREGRGGRKEYPVDKSLGGINAAPTNKWSVQFPGGVAGCINYGSGCPCLRSFVWDIEIPDGLGEWQGAEVDKANFLWYMNYRFASACKIRCSPCGVHDGQSPGGERGPIGQTLSAGASALVRRTVGEGVFTDR